MIVNTFTIRVYMIGDNGHKNYDKMKKICESTGLNYEIVKTEEHEL